MLYNNIRGDDIIMKPVDNKVRKSIIKAKERKEKRETIALWLDISISTVDKVWKRYKETGTYLAIPYTGRKSKISDETDEKIRAIIKEYPDITLIELIDELSLPLTPSGLCRKLNKMGLSYKKRHSIPQHKSAKML